MCGGLCVVGLGPWGAGCGSDMYCAMCNVWCAGSVMCVVRGRIVLCIWLCRDVFGVCSMVCDV